MDAGDYEGALVFLPRAMPSTYSNLTDDERLARLDELSYETFINLLPTVIFVAILITIGVPGNSLVFYIYFRLFQPSATRVFVLALASCDLMINVFSLPRHILLMRFAYHSRGVTFCRVLGTLAVFPILLSYWLLAVVALDRRHRICNPLQEHLNPRQAVFALFVPVLLTSLALLPFAALQEEGPFPTGYTGLMGITCRFSKDYHGFNLKKAYGLTLTFSYALILMVLVFSYAQILWKVYQMKQELERHRLQQLESMRAPPPSSDKPIVRDVQQTTVPTPEPEDPVYGSSVDLPVPASLERNPQGPGQDGTISPTHTQTQTLTHTPTGNPNWKSRTTRKDSDSLHAESVNDDEPSQDVSSSKVWTSQTESRNRWNPPPRHQPATPQQSSQQPQGLMSRTTLMMFVLTAITIVCCVPYFALELSQLQYVGKDITPGTMNFRFLLRVFPSVNSVINPFIYNCFNARFREQCIRTLQKLRSELCPEV